MTPPKPAREWWINQRDAFETDMGVPESLTHVISYDSYLTLQQRVSELEAELQVRRNKDDGLIDFNQELLHKHIARDGNALLVKQLKEQCERLAGHLRMFVDAHFRGGPGNYKYEDAKKDLSAYEAWRERV